VRVARDIRTDGEGSVIRFDATPQVRATTVGAGRHPLFGPVPRELAPRTTEKSISLAPEVL